jgi:integrase
MMPPDAVGAAMPSKPKRGRPRPQAVGDVRLRVIRGPRKDGRWYWRAEYHVDRSTVWTGWGSPDEAKRSVVKHVAEHGYAAAPDDRHVHLSTLDDMMRAWFAYLEDKRTELAAASMKTYRGCVRRLRAVAGTVACSRLPTGAGMDVRARLIDRYALPTVQTTIVGFNAAWKWARAEGLVADVALVLPGVKLPVVENWTPTDEHIAKVIAHIEDSRWRTVIETMLETGARPVDLARAERLEHGGIVLDGKTGQRWVPLPPALFARLQALRASHEGPKIVPFTEDYLRAGGWRKLDEASRAANLPRVNARAIRRACSDRLLRARVELATYAGWMGHGPVVALRNYRKATHDDLRIGAALVRQKAEKAKASGDAGEVIQGPWQDDEP